MKKRDDQVPRPRAAGPGFDPRLARKGPGMAEFLRRGTESLTIGTATLSTFGENLVLPPLKDDDDDGEDFASGAFNLQEEAARGHIQALRSAAKSFPDLVRGAPPPEPIEEVLQRKSAMARLAMGLDRVISDGEDAQLIYLAFTTTLEERLVAWVERQLADDDVSEAEKEGLRAEFAEYFEEVRKGKDAVAGEQSDAQERLDQVTAEIGDSEEELRTLKTEDAVRRGERPPAEQVLEAHGRRQADAPAPSPALSDNRRETDR